MRVTMPLPASGEQARAVRQQLELAVATVQSDPEFTCARLLECLRIYRARIHGVMPCSQGTALEGVSDD